jgi:hypothetical protein
MVNVFGDDSADETKQRVFAVAGVIATAAVWEKLERQWLDRNCGIPFHATDCDSDQGDYADRPHAKNKEQYRDLIHILADSGAWGFGTALDLSGYRDFYPPDTDQLAYYKAFFEVVRFLADLGKTHFHDSVKFTFDYRAESNYPAGQLYSALLKDRSLDAPKIFGEISFASSREQPRIQIADLLARETMKELDNRIGPIKRNRRKSMQALVDTGHFGFDLLLREFFEDMRKKTLELERQDKEFNRFKYAEWLRNYRLDDNAANRFKFLAFVSAKDPL